MIKMTMRVKSYTINQMEFEQTLEGVNLEAAQITGLIKKWQNEQGCISYQLFKQNVRNYCLESEWQSWEDLKYHFRSKDFTLFLGALDLLCEQQQVEIFDGKSTLGIEAIEDARAN